MRGRQVGQGSVQGVDVAHAMLTHDSRAPVHAPTVHAPHNRASGQVARRHAGEKEPAAGEPGGPRRAYIGEKEEETVK